MIEQLAFWTVIGIGGLWLYLSAASMLGTLLKQRRQADSREYVEPEAGAPEGDDRNKAADFSFARSGK